MMRFIGCEGKVTQLQKKKAQITRNLNGLSEQIANEFEHMR